MFTYTRPELPYDDGSSVIYVDQDCTAPATITVNGAPVPGSQINTSADGSWPQFQSPSNPVYILTSDNVAMPLTPTMNYGSTQAVTGSRGGNAALGSLIAALVAAGVPISDQTTA